MGRAVLETGTETSISAVALGVASGTTKVLLGSGDHVVNTELSACWEGVDVLGGNGCDKGSEGNEAELHFERGCVGGWIKGGEGIR